MSTAFVLTGGGSLGAAQVGMLEALEERGVRPDLLVGTSVGAVNAAFLGGPGSYPARLLALAGLWKLLRRRDLFAPDPRRWLDATLRSGPSLFAADPLRHLLEDNLGYSDLDGARTPVHVLTTDLTTGATRVLSTGDAVSAVLASAAVPGLLPPVRRDGSTFIDGGFGPHLALAHADRLGVDDIYLVPAGYPCAPRRTPTSAVGVTLTALALLLHVQLLTEVEEYAGRARLHVLPPLCPVVVSPADFGHASQLMSRAHEQAATWLAEPVADLRPAAPLALHDHRPPVPGAGADGAVLGDTA